MLWKAFNKLFLLICVHLSENAVALECQNIIISCYRNVIKPENK